MIETIDLSEIGALLEEWGDWSRRGGNNHNLGYQSPSYLLMRDNVQQNNSGRRQLYYVEDEGYYSLIERELGRMRTSHDRLLVMWSRLIKRRYVYGMSLKRLSKSLVSKYEYGEDTTVCCHARKVQAHLEGAEEYLYNALMG